MANLILYQLIVLLMGQAHTKTLAAKRVIPIVKNLSSIFTITGTANATVLGTDRLPITLTSRTGFLAGCDDCQPHRQSAEGLS